MSEFDVVGFGALNFDQVAVVERELDGEEGAQYGIIGREVGVPGGSSANTVYGVARLGLKASFMGAVGPDSKGEMILQQFREQGVDLSGIAVKTGPTGVVQVFSHANSDRNMFIQPGANSAYTRQDLDEALARIIPKARLVHLTSFVGDKQLELQEELLRHLHPSLQVSFSPGQLYVKRGMAQIEDMVGSTDLLFGNNREICGLTERAANDIEAAATELLAGFPRLKAVIITLGPGEETQSSGGQKLSSIILARKQATPVMTPALFLPGPLDGTGAGDAFAAGVLYEILQGGDWAEAGHTGKLVAAFCLKQVGARAGLPTRQQLQQAKQGGFPTA